MTHDIISDILAADTVPAGRKREVIYAALDQMQDSTRDVMTMDEWCNVGEMMGWDRNHGRGGDRAPFAAGAGSPGDGLDADDASSFRRFNPGRPTWGASCPIRQEAPSPLHTRDAPIAGFRRPPAPTPADEGHVGEPMLLLERSYPNEASVEERQRLLEHTLRRGAAMWIAVCFATEYYWDASKTSRGLKTDMNKVLEDLCLKYGTDVEKK